MPTFLIISRHSPENCPINNEKMKKMTLELPDKLGMDRNSGTPVGLGVRSSKLGSAADILHGTRDGKMDGLEHK
jgi:hypothetical protein